MGGVHGFGVFETAVMPPTACRRPDWRNATNDSTSCVDRALRSEFKYPCRISQVVGPVNAMRKV